MNYSAVQCLTDETPTAIKTRVVAVEKNWLYCDLEKCFTVDQGTKNSAPQFCRLSDIDHLSGKAFTIMIQSSLLRSAIDGRTSISIDAILLP